VIDPTTPATLYAGTERGVFKSSDGAASWTRLTDSSAGLLAIDSTTPATLYAEIDFRLFKSFWFVR
jgi:hypothetical protein